MKNLNLALCVLAVIAAASLLATPQAHAERGTIGFGTDLNLFSPATGLSNVKVPIHLNESFMLEPELGLTYTSSEEGEGDAKETSSEMNLRFGVGALYKSAITKKTNLYGGARLGMIRTSRDYDFGDYSSERSQNTFFAGGVTGAEYFINDAFSIGGEWGVYFITEGEPDRTVTNGDNTTTNDDDSESSNLAISTATTVNIRWYFR